ncbi:MAG: M20 family metallopeptidase [Bacteroidales bacterium]|nr:M20 family metallopeptidase [Bacteroidales bacterium]
MNDLKERIKTLARIYHSEAIAMRRHLHSFPELSGAEEKTAAFIVEQLKKLDIEYTEGIGGYGVVGMIGKESGNQGCIALRADMDALPILEKNDVSYKSRHAGVMHACGHDAHTAVLITAAHILKDIEEELDHPVKLIFQPSEERFPGGAKQMIEAGVLKNPDVVAVIAQHVFPSLPAGKVGFRSGQYMASTDEVYLTIKGKGGHAATPSENIDPVVTGAHILVALQQVVSRNAPHNIPTVLSFGRFIADGETNIIPHEVKVAGTLRTFNEVWRKEAHQRITEIAQKTAESMGAQCEVVIDKGYPFLVNDSSVTEKAASLAREFLGNDNVEELDIRMTAEDFAYFSQSAPSCLYRFGISNEKRGIVHNLHTPEFDIDERSLETAAGVMAYIAGAFHREKQRSL